MQRTSRADVLMTVPVSFDKDVNLRIEEVVRIDLATKRSPGRRDQGVSRRLDFLAFERFLKGFLDLGKHSPLEPRS